MKISEKSTAAANLLKAHQRFQNAVQRQGHVAFVVDDTLVDKIGEETVLTVFCTDRYDGDEFHFDIVLESPIYRRQERGQKELGRLCDSVGLRSIEDSPELHGKESILRRAIEGEFFFTSHNIVFEAA